MPELILPGRIQSLRGKDNGTSDWVLIDQNTINRFADATGDDQWIHVDINKAKKGPFGNTIGHGYLILSLSPIFNRSAKFHYDGLKMSINYGLNKVRFTNPVPVDSYIRSKMTISDVEKKGSNRFLITTTHTIEIKGQNKPACIAEVLTMLVF